MRPLAIALLAFMCTACHMGPRARLLPPPPPDDRYPPDRPDIGETLALLTDETIYAEEIVRPVPIVTHDCTLQKGGHLVAMSTNYRHFLLRYVAASIRRPGDCPNGTMFMSEMRNYGLQAWNAKKQKIYVHDTPISSLHKSRKDFNAALDHHPRAEQ